MSEAQQVNPQDARAFVSEFVPDPSQVINMPDDQVIALHKRVSDGVAKYGPKSVPFGEKWRETLAGEDQDALKTLGRFPDPQGLWKSYSELRSKLSKGELRANVPFPEKGTVEEQTAWRKERGIPEKPEAYDTNLGDGLVIGDEDKPFVESYLQAAHANNVPADVAKANLKWYFGTYIPQVEQARGEEDVEYRAEAQETLRERWGPDYKRNVEAVKALVMQAPEALRERFWGGRLADGKALGDDPDVLQWLAGIALELNPATAMTGHTGADTTANIDGRIKQIEETMRKDRSAYNKDARMQEEYRNLIDARERLQSRGKAA